MTTTTSEPDRLRRWLHEVMATTGLKATPLAQKVGISPSTLTRALDPNEPGYLSSRTVEKIVQKLGVSPPGGGDGRSRSGGFGEPELQKLDDAQMQFMALRPSNNQGVWEIKSRALELEGYIPGDIVLVDSTVAPAPGDVVCAQVYNFERGDADTVLRIFDAPYLVTATADREARQKPQLVDNERVVIWGTVVKSIRERRAS